MRRLIWLLPAVFFFCIPASAQETPQWELSGGYSHFFATIGKESAIRCLFLPKMKENFRGENADRNFCNA